jgi:non-specific serine/threonine protein kinase
VAKKFVGDQLEADLPNIRGALAWAERAQNADLMLRLTLALWWYWESRGSMEEACAWLERTIEATTEVPPSFLGRRAELLAVAVLAATWQGNYDRAAILADSASLLAQETGDARALAMAALCKGHLALWQEDWDHAKSYLTDALARWRKLEPSKGLIAALNHLGFLAALQDNQMEAESWFTESVAISRAAGWVVPIAFGLEALGSSAPEQGDNGRAVSLFAEALTYAQGGNDIGAIANCLKSLGAVAADTGNAEQGARLLGAAEALRERGGSAQPATELERLEEVAASARAQLSADVFAAAWSAGREMPHSQAIAEAFEVASEFNSPRPPVSMGLTPREIEVLRLLVEGLSDKEIAEALGTSRRTASKHVETIRGKLDVPSRTAAAMYATRHGLI